MHIMLDDVTRQFFTRHGRLLSVPLYEALDEAVTHTSVHLRHPRDSHPHLHALHIRADLRAHLEITPLPEGWEVGGNSRATEQIYLHHRESASDLRLLSESTVNPGGTPHAGHTYARQMQWSVANTNDALLSDRSMLLLVDTRSQMSTLRIVHPVERGKYKGRVLCDFESKMLRDISAMPERFEASDEYSNLFEVEVSEFGSDE